MHCASKLDTNNRGVGASKVDAAAQDGVGSSTPGNPGASEVHATLAGAVQARSTRE